MKKILFLTGCLVSTMAFAQNETDALRYTQQTFFGTARSMSLGGAFGALGGDFSTLSNNPAGIAIYKKSEFSFTPNLFLNNTSTEYLNETRDNSKNSFNFGNAGLVYTYNNAETGWVNLNFGFGYNKLNNFNSRKTYSGINNSSSLLDSYIERLDGTDPNQIENGPVDLDLAYSTGLVYLKNPSGTQYRSDIPNGGVRQTRNVSTKGAMGEMVFTFGANYDDKVYLGGTLGFTSIDYTENSTYKEEDPDNSIKYFQSLNLVQNFTTTGSGVNLKLGSIFRPADWVRIGLAYHTPTFYSLTDVYDYNMTSQFDSTVIKLTDTTSTSKSSKSISGQSDYELTTSSKGIVSIAFILAKKGLISFDYETVNYAAASLSTSTALFDFAKENEAITNKYHRASNFRFGLEYRLNEIFSLRGGYGIYGSPYKVDPGNTQRTSISAGLGIRGKGYFIDLAYVIDQYNTYYYPYSLNSIDVAPAKTAVENDRYVMTLGFKF